MHIELIALDALRYQLYIKAPIKFNANTITGIRLQEELTHRCNKYSLETVPL